MYVVPTDTNGMLDPYQIEIGIADGSDEHSAPTALLCIENTHNRCGGAVLNVEQIETLTSLAHAHGLKVPTGVGNHLREEIGKLYIN